jgi:ParB family chromosome partitioning protein
VKALQRGFSMTKRKRFGISSHLKQGLSDTFSMVENHDGLYTNAVIPIDRITLDPNNPRKLTVTKADILHSINPEDSHFEVKQREYEKLSELAESIKSEGILHPIIAYKHGDDYRVVAGERRCLASIIAKKRFIEARVFNEKPTGYKLKLVQWIENNERENLNLPQRINNVLDIIEAYKEEQGDVAVDAHVLAKITKLSRPQAISYLTIIESPQDVLEQVHIGKITNLDKAALLAKIDDEAFRKEALSYCINGSSLIQLRQYVNAGLKFKRKMEHGYKLKQSVGRNSTKVNFGSTAQTKVVKVIVDAVVNQQAYAIYKKEFKNVHWEDYNAAAKAFRELVQHLETHHKK